MRSHLRLRWASSRCAACRKVWRASWARKASTSPTLSSTAAFAARAVRRMPTEPDALLDPDAIAQSYLQVLQQPRNAWSQEIELRPWVEKF